MIKWLMGLFKKKAAEEPQKKIRLTIKDDKLVCVSIPHHILASHCEPVIRQEIACYEMKLSGQTLVGGLGGLGGVGITPYNYY